MTRLMAPNGSKIVATLEVIRGEALLEGVTRDENGTIAARYLGQTSYDWEGQTTVKRQPDGGGALETVYLDGTGQEWLESQLVPMPDWQADDAVAAVPSMTQMRRFR